MTAKIIAICGHEDSGKSTSARFIASALERKGFTTKIISFATPLKELANVHMGVDKSDRDKLELFGLDVRRILGYNVFTNYTMREIEMSKYDYYIIDDLRYVNELENLHAVDYPTHILKTRTLTSPRSMDDTRLDELLTFMEVNNITTITLPDEYSDLYRFIEKFVELVR